jgi:hypothetical protein
MEFLKIYFLFMVTWKECVKKTPIKIGTPRYYRLNWAFPHNKHVLHFFVKDDSCFSSEPSLTP